MYDAMRLLDEMRYRGDPVADEVAREIGKHMDVRQVADLLTGLARFGPAACEDICSGHPRVEAAMERFRRQTLSLPEGHEHREIADGRHPFQDNAVLGFMVLGCASLLECYCWRDEARLLGLTQQLSEHVARRIPETAQFVLDVMGDWAILGDPHQDWGMEDHPASGADTVPAGVEAIQKVRLMHALMRWLILKDPGEVDDFLGEDPMPARWEHMMLSQWSIPVSGYPISQAYLAGTLLTFSYVVVDGLRRLWAPVSDAHARDYLQRWKAIGYKLGLDERLLAYLDDMESARVLHQAMMVRFRAPTADGAQLAAALERYMIANIVDQIPLHRLFGMQRFPRVVMWHLAGPETCRAVGMVPGLVGRTFGWLVWQGLRLIGLMKRLPLLKHLSQRVFEWLGRSIWGWRRDDDEDPDARPGPRIAVAHADAWGVPRIGD